MLRSLLHQHVHFLLADFDAICLTDFGKQQTKANAADGDIAILFALGFHFLLRSFGVFFAGGFLLQLRPNLFEFCFDHRWRHVKVMIRSKLIKQLALHIRAGQAVMFLLNLNLHQFTQLVDTFKAEHLGKIVIRFRFDWLAYFGDDDVKRRGLALQVFGIVIFGEGYVQNLLVIGFDANELVFETGDQLA